MNKYKISVYKVGLDIDILYNKYTVPINFISLTTYILI